MKIALITILFLTSFYSHAYHLVCSSDDPTAWTSVRLIPMNSNELDFIITGTVPNRREDIGSIAKMRKVKVVKPGGRVFFNYRGFFVGGKPQKSLSIYLSEDESTLTRLSGDGVEYYCYNDSYGGH